ncbi:two-component system response regulator RssB [Xenorhabdus bovienii]|uniref:two-component system response regulator RssB n=1 Tax=Xenorhabdus bovienii TaxID=40576 RepID=UPI0023B226C9|nr:two-component system response regulator RssB [Xenorhabdus bovienii]MDE9431871.1 two-component system response regulator RssB [Xenorhabdus bovienii]MDE9489597.1 two-component system response regulator RssB [Xenorhabdus bovienii]MDE9505711.1 two-component system response regulator RssB [Xenorhabdus bovienii]MDE9545840.1 two-component system response regulator RssB [Xenorhabdus bovienii]
MEKVLQGKRILVVEDEPVFCSLLTDYLNSLGAITMCASNGEMALQTVDREIKPELIFCDLSMPIMDGIEFMGHMAMKGLTIPIIIVSATNKMTEIDDVLRLGAKDILLKPIANLNEVKKMALDYLHPKVFMSDAIEQNRLIQELSKLKQNTESVWCLLQQLQPPVSQIIANCRVNYRLLNTVGKMGLVFDITALSDNEMIFYCLDISRSKDNGAVSALLLRVVFNNLLKKRKFHKKSGLPDMQEIMNWVNRILNDMEISEPLPLLLGYYNTHNKTILMSSAGLSARIQSGNHQQQLGRGIPHGTLKIIHSHQVCEHSSLWQCRIWNNKNQIKLMFSPPFYQ